MITQRRRPNVMDTRLAVWMLRNGMTQIGDTESQIVIGRVDQMFQETKSVKKSLELKAMLYDRLAGPPTCTASEVKPFNSAVALEIFLKHTSSRQF